MEYKISMPYIGGVLSDNSYKFSTRKTKPVVVIWKKELALKASKFSIPEASHYKIRIFGHFTDERHPDLSNLHKVIGDGLKQSLPKDDKYYRYEDLGVELGNWDPWLDIYIEPFEEANRLGALAYGQIGNP